MPVTTTHKFIDIHNFKKQDTRMIIGTIHPHLVEGFSLDFFYGNVGSFWSILENAFPQHNFRTVESILNIFSKYNIWMTDIIRKCDRAHERVTRDSELYNITYNDGFITTGILNSNIDTIFFTSRFGANNAAKLFTQTFGINYLENFDPNTSEFTIPEEYFGRTIKGIVLYSPSNDANRGIARSLPYINNHAYYQQFATPIKQFKIDFYREKFSFLND